MVLLVEPDEQLASRLLASLDGVASVHRCVGFNEARDWLRTTQPDLLVSNLRLGEQRFAAGLLRGERGDADTRRRLSRTIVTLRAKFNARARSTTRRIVSRSVFVRTSPRHCLHAIAVIRSDWTDWVTPPAAASPIGRPRIRPFSARREHHTDGVQVVVQRLHEAPSADQVIQRCRRE
jgi:hypothetical protein